MPNKTIYIRKEDLDKWESIEDKPGFIHNALSDSGRPQTLDEAIAAYSRPMNGLPFKPCKHGADPKFCRFAKNGKPCKS